MTMRLPEIALLLVACGAPACLDPDEPGNLVPPTVDEDPSLPRIDVNGTSLHSEAFGRTDAPMVVFLHSGPGGDYRYLLPYRILADDGYRVVFWDQRGAGLSRRHEPSTYDLKTYLEDLRQVIEHYTATPGQRIVIVGQSWGAMYATAFINERGDYGGRIRGAVLSEPGAFTSDGLEEYMKKSFPPWKTTSEELNDVLWADQVISKKTHARADYLGMLAILEGFPREHNDENNRAPAWRFGSAGASALAKVAMKDGFDWTTNLRAYPNEVLFIRGDLNENLPLEQQQELASHYGRSRLVTIHGAGHHVIWERQTEYLSHLRPYLAAAFADVSEKNGGAL